MINGLKTLIEKVDNKQEEMGNMNIEMGILRKKQVEMSKIKSTLKEMNNAFDGLISRLNIAEKRLFGIDK